MKSKGANKGKRYTDSELQIFALRIAKRGRATAAEAALMSQPGSTGKRLKEFVRAAQAARQATKSKGAKKETSGAGSKLFSPHASRTSDLLRLAKESPDQARLFLLTALRRSLTLGEFAARLEIAPATLSKVIAELGEEYESLRAAAEGPSAVVQAALMSALAVLAEDLQHSELGPVTGERLQDAFRKVTLVPDPPSAAAAAPAAPAVPAGAALEGPERVAPETLEGWLTSCDRDLELVGPLSFEEESTAIAHRAHLFLRWVDEQPMAIASEDGTQFVNPLKHIPSRILLSPQRIDGYPDKPLRSYLAAFVAAVITQIGVRPKVGSFRFDALQADIGWLVTHGYPGAAQALSTLCALPVNVNSSAMFRLTRNDLLEAHKQGKIALNKADHEQLHASV